MIKKYAAHGMRLALSKKAWHTYAIFSGNIASMAAAFFFIVILVRTLSKIDFGYFSALFNLLLLLSDLADFGVGSSLSRFLPPLAKDKEKQQVFLKTACVLQLCLSITLAIVMAILSPWISTRMFHSEMYAGLIVIVGLGVVGSIMVNFFLSTLLAKEHFWLGSLYSGLSGIARLVAIGILALIGQLYLTPVMWAVTISFIVLAFAGLLITGTDFFSYRFNMADVRKLFSYSAFLAVARGITAISGRLDVLMIFPMVGPIATGTYATASRVASIYALFSGSFSTVVAPRVAAVESKKELISFLWMIILATVGLIATIFFPLVFARFFLVLLFGVDKGLPSVEIFRVLLVGMIFFVASIPAVSIALYHLHKPHILTVNSFLQLITVASLNLVLIPRYQAVGAAYSLIVAYALSFIVTSGMSWYYWNQRYHDVPAVDRPYGRKK